MNFMRIVICAAATITAIPLQAATLTPHGSVMMNDGTGFARIVKARNVGAADVILVNDGHADLECPDERGGSIKDGRNAIRLHAGRTYTVGEVCDAGAAPELQTGIQAGSAAIVGAAIVTAVTIPLVSPDSRDTSPPGRRPTSP